MAKIIDPGRPDDARAPSLGGRLACIAAMVGHTNTVADIGYDHGNLMAALILSGQVEQAVGIEIAPRFAERFQRRWGQALGDKRGRIQLRAGDGAGPLMANEAQVVVVAGVGEPTLLEIARGAIGVDGVERLVLCPARRRGLFRRALEAEGWAVDDEQVVHDSGRFYEVVAWCRGSSPAATPAWADLFGRTLVARRDEVLLQSLIRVRAQIGDGMGAILEHPPSPASSPSRRAFHAMVRALDPAIAWLSP